MAGFYGTEQQMALQAVAENAHDWVMNTAGACDPGRFLGTDNPDELGWDRIIEILKRDGVFGFRMIPSKDIETVSRRLAEYDCKIDFWDVFVAKRDEALCATSTILTSKLPNGYGYLPTLRGAENKETIMVQAFMAENGIAPFSGSKLAGLEGPVITVAIIDESENLAAVAHACLPYNKYSQYKKFAWGGLVAVSPSHRGMGLGKYVNAKMVSESFSCLDIEYIHEFVTETNIPSRKMVEASGLRLDLTVKSGIAMRGGEERFTR